MTEDEILSRKKAKNVFSKLEGPRGGVEAEGGGRGRGELRRVVGRGERGGRDGDRGGKGE